MPSPSKQPHEGAEQGALEVTAETAGATLAALVRRLAPGTSWSRAREAIRLGRVLLDGRVATDPAHRPAAGSRVELLPPAGRGMDASGVGGGTGGGTARGQPPLVVYSDADLVIVRKPPGVLTVPFERGDRDTLVALTRVALRRLDPGGRATLRAVQRLDRDTSGLVVLARTVTAQRRLQEQFAAREVKRHYLAIAHGEVAAATYDTVLVEDRGDGLRGSAAGSPPAEGRRAVTHVFPVEPLAGATLVCCTLETGRTHQVRIHLAEAGHPLVGEKVYIRGYAGPLIAAPRPMLHAAALGFRHPRDRRELVFEEPPPTDFAALLAALRPAGR